MDDPVAKTCRRDLAATRRALASLRKKVKSRPDRRSLTYLIGQLDKNVADLRRSTCSLPGPVQFDCMGEIAFLHASWVSLQSDLQN
ncbi:hypothetical protein [Nonomuraea sp. B19D2]|uniref:hypothetical protein n=1 Tax=Nonomuraea sp. B19D2 TaxID=3159561 RepID=UPI0032DB23DE